MAIFNNLPRMSNNMIENVRSIEQALIHHDEYRIHYDMIMNLPIVVQLQQEIACLRQALHLSTKETKVIDCTTDEDFTQVKIKEEQVDDETKKVIYHMRNTWNFCFVYPISFVYHWNGVSVVGNGTYRYWFIVRCILITL